jgi:hypothetical protein
MLHGQSRGCPFLGFSWQGIYLHLSSNKEEAIKGKSAKTFDMRMRLIIIFACPRIELPIKFAPLVNAGNEEVANYTPV